MEFTLDLKTYLESISFSGLEPTDAGIMLLCGLSDNPVLTSADYAITKLPENDTLIRSRLAPIMHIPRMCTFAIGSLINRIVAQMDPSLAYVNVGVWQGYSFLSGILGNANKMCVAVDNFSQFGGPKEQFASRFEGCRSELHQFYDVDYREYFQSIHQGPIGFYIYDGDHKKEHQREGLAAAEPFLAKGALILVDDINLDDPIDGTIEFVQSSKHKYQVIKEIHTAHNSHPTFWNGIALLQKMT